MVGMKKIFLDENMRNAKIVRKLRKLGYKLVFTPQGVSDYDLEDWLVTVSYTHLTLPTIYSV